jgi:hypothetical protein
MSGSQVGTAQTLVACVPSQVEQAPCPSGMGLTTVQGYVIDPAQAASIDAQNAPFDYALAAGFWAMAFTFVVALHLVTKSAGVIVERIRK